MCNQCIANLKLCGSCKFVNVHEVSQSGPCEVVLTLCCKDGNKETDGVDTCPDYIKGPGIDTSYEDSGPKCFEQFDY